MITNTVGWHTEVGIPTLYWMDGPEIKSRGGGGRRDVPHPSLPALGPIQPPEQRVPVLSPGGKIAGVCH